MTYDLALMKIFEFKTNFRKNPLWEVIIENIYYISHQLCIGLTDHL